MEFTDWSTANYDLKSGGVASVTKAAIASSSPAVF